MPPLQPGSRRCLALERTIRRPDEVGCTRSKKNDPRRTPARSPMLLPVISVAGVIKRRAGKVALAGIELAVEPGQVACLIGSSGSGKTTLLRCINGLES